VSSATKWISFKPGASDTRVLKLPGTQAMVRPFTSSVAGFESLSVPLTTIDASIVEKPSLGVVMVTLGGARSGV
jgi:hypothetical protein